MNVDKKFLTKTCVFCDKGFVTKTSKTRQRRGGHYEEHFVDILIYNVIQEVYLLKFEPLYFDWVDENLKEILNKKIEDLELKLNSSAIDTALLSFLKNKGSDYEKQLYTKAKSILTERQFFTDTLSAPTKYIGRDEEFSPHEYKCHKRCLPSKNIFTVDNLIKNTTLSHIYSNQFKELPSTYMTIIPNLKKQEIKISYQEYTPPDLEKGGKGGE